MFRTTPNDKLHKSLGAAHNEELVLDMKTNNFFVKMDEFFSSKNKKAPVESPFGIF